MWFWFVVEVFLFLTLFKLFPLSSRFRWPLHAYICIYSFFWVFQHFHMVFVSIFIHYEHSYRFFTSLIFISSTRIQMVIITYYFWITLFCQQSSQTMLLWVEIWVLGIASVLFPQVNLTNGIYTETYGQNKRLFLIPTGSTFLGIMTIHSWTVGRLLGYHPVFVNGYSASCLCESCKQDFVVYSRNWFNIFSQWMNFISNNS